MMSLSNRPERLRFKNLTIVAGVYASHEPNLSTISATLRPLFEGHNSQECYRLELI